VTYISDADIKGWMPNSLKNKLTEMQGGLAYRIEVIMTEEKNIRLQKN
jgi:hypothetical protein